MATFTVTSAADFGPGSLRQAISDANNTDTILFDPSIAGQTITLGSPLFINEGITIDGTGRNITISGNNTVTDFVINNASSVRTTIRGLTIADGNGTGLTGVDGSPGTPGGGAAGGVFVGLGTVRLENNVFRNDAATGGDGGDGSGFSSGGDGGAGAGGVYVGAGANVTLTGDHFIDDTGAGGSAGLGLFASSGGDGAGAVYVASGGTVSASNLTFSGNSAFGGGFPFTGQAYSDSNSDIVNDAAVCFCSGTLIRTTRGEVPVERLAIGDTLLTADGETRPVTWIGHQTIVAAFADPVRSYPIRIAAGAIADNVPARDLFLSPDHALLIDGVLVQAGALVNGSTVTRVMNPEARFTYYHVETDDHAIILAEVAAAETFVSNVTRRRFDNYAEYEALFGTRADFEAMADRDEPRAMSARQVPARIRARLAERAAVLMPAEAAAA